MPQKETQNQHYLLIEAVINYLLDHQTQQPELTEIAAHFSLSEFSFKRIFVDWVGISPTRFLQFLTPKYLKAQLNIGYSNINAAYQLGLSGNGSCHKLFVNIKAITPTQYKRLSKGLYIDYGFHSSPFGDYLLAVTEKRICHISFVEHSKEETEATFKTEWHLTKVGRNEKKTNETHQKIFSSNSTQELKLLLRGTQFQVQIWQALLNIPFGAVSNYENLAAATGKISATRPAASAIAKNKIAYLIPCHRVIRKNGESGEFRWGKNKKKILLAYESAVSKN